MNFIKVLLGSCLGTILGIIILFFIGFGIISGIASMAGNKNQDPIDKNSFLEIRADRVYPEKTDNTEADAFSFNNNKILGLHDMVTAIRHAKSDPKIKGISYRSMYSTLSPASASVLHHALIDFRKSGKPVYAFADAFTEGSYYIASAANKIIINPNGSVDMNGFGALIPYFKEVLDKIGVKFNIYYAGQFKSATEPFRLDKMSEQNRAQTREYLNDIYHTHLSDISAARNIPIATLQSIGNDLLIRNAEDAIKYKLADSIGYLDDYYRLISNDLSESLKEKPSMVTINRYFDSPGIKPFVSSANDKLAVVYAEGDIVDGEGQYGQIGSVKYTRILRKIRFDNKVKAVVLRVNSPGGSSLASDNLLHEIELLKKAGKPVVVSMGDYAASGGYYIACSADSIFAQANTLTGSIGVFFMIPNAAEMFDNKIGINFDTVGTGRFSNAFTAVLPWSSEEGLIAQQQTDKIYDQFLGVVSSGRKKSKEQIHEIAQGRVWTGNHAVANGLVDKLGTLDDAIACAVRLGKLDKYKTVEYPTVKEPFQKMLDDILGMEDKSEEMMLKKVFKSWYPAVSTIKNMEASYYKPLMRLPFNITLF